MHGATVKTVFLRKKMRQWVNDSQLLEENCRFRNVCDSSLSDAVLYPTNTKPRPHRNPHPAAAHQ